MSDNQRTRPSDAEAEFVAWLERELPAGTIIGDPSWWAFRILQNLRQNRALSTPPLPSAPKEVYTKEQAEAMVALALAADRSARALRAEPWACVHCNRACTATEETCPWCGKAAGVITLPSAEPVAWKVRDVTATGFQKLPFAVFDADDAKGYADADGGRFDVTPLFTTPPAAAQEAP